MKAIEREHRKRRYWRAGADAFAKLDLGLQPYYVCPLCLHGFTEDQTPALTWEDVPPRAVGGRELVLTCSNCNSVAGHKVDSHAAEFERVSEFFQRKPGRTYPIRYRAEGGIDVNAEAEWSADGALSIAGVPQCNPPGALDQWSNDLTRRHREKRGWPNSQVSLRIGKRVSLQRVSVSWLRAAYLAAFAIFGYRYIFRRHLDLVRKQISQPDISLIKSFYQEVPIDSADERAILLLNSPRWARGVAVRMGKRLVLLPYHDEASIYYERLVRESEEGMRVTFVGKVFPWPVRPEFRLDYARPSERVLYSKLVNSEL